MKADNKRILLGILYGLLRGSIFFLLVEYIISTYLEEYSHAFIAAGLCATISIFFFVLGSLYLKKQIGVFYLLSHCVFAAVIAFIFCNYIGGYFHIFPSRILSNGDGIIVIFATLLNGCVAGTGRIVAFFFIKLIGKRQN